LPYDEPIELAEVSGEWIAARAKEASETGLAIVGVSADGSSVNGRPLEARASYRVATLRFLARGGDAALPPGMPWVPVRGALRSSLLDFLAVPRSIDPRDAVPDPATSVEWILRPDLDARLSSSSIANPAGYPSAPLQRRSSATAGVEANVRLAADAPAWLWENAALWRYKSTRTAAPPGTSIERDNLETLRSTFTFRTLFGRPRTYLPQPYLEAYGETESASLNGGGARRGLGRGSAGLRLSPHAKLALKLAGALERDFGQATPRTLLGANAQVTLSPWEIARLGERSLEVDSLFDAFAGGATAQVTVRAHAGVLMDLIGPLSFVLGADLYAERDGSGPFGVALDTSAGIRLRMLKRGSSF
jgi:hypothetical protein